MNKQKVDFKDTKNQPIQQLTNLTCIPSSVVFDGLPDIGDRCKMQDVKSKHRVQVENDAIPETAVMKSRDCSVKAQLKENTDSCITHLTDKPDHGSSVNLRGDNSLSKPHLKHSDDLRLTSSCVSFASDRLSDAICDRTAASASSRFAAVCDQTSSDKCEKRSSGTNQLVIADGLSNDVQICHNAIQMSQTTRRFTKTGIFNISSYVT